MWHILCAEDKKVVKLLVFIRYEDGIISSSLVLVGACTTIWYLLKLTNILIRCCLFNLSFLLVTCLFSLNLPRKAKIMTLVKTQLRVDYLWMRIYIRTVWKSMDAFLFFSFLFIIFEIYEYHIQHDFVLVTHHTLWDQCLLTWNCAQMINRRKKVLRSTNP